MNKEQFNRNYNWSERMGEPEYIYRRDRGAPVDWDAYFCYLDTRFDLAEPVMLDVAWTMLDAGLHERPIIEWSKFQKVAPASPINTRCYLAYVAQDRIHHNTSSKKLVLLRRLEPPVDLQYSWFSAVRHWSTTALAFRMSTEWFLLEYAYSHRYYQWVKSPVQETTLHQDA